MTGPVVQTLVNQLESATTVGEPSTLDAAFSQKWAPKTSAARYETARKADHFVLMVHATEADTSKAHEALFKINSWKDSA